MTVFLLLIGLTWFLTVLLLPILIIIFVKNLLVKRWLIVGIYFLNLVVFFILWRTDDAGITKIPLVISSFIFLFALFRLIDDLTKGKKHK